MVKAIDRIWLWLIARAPSWAWTRRLMYWRAKWYSRYREWDKETKAWVKIGQAKRTVEAGDEEH